MPIRTIAERPDGGACAGHAHSVARARRPWAVRLAVWPIRAYQWLVSPLIGPRCRFLPTCSEYALEALESHGLIRGSGLAVRRVVRCHPWGGSGYDPVPHPGGAPGGAGDRATPPGSTHR